MSFPGEWEPVKVNVRQVHISERYMAQIHQASKQSVCGWKKHCSVRSMQCTENGQLSQIVVIGSGAHGVLMAGRRTD